MRLQALELAAGLCYTFVGFGGPESLGIELNLLDGAAAAAASSGARYARRSAPRRSARTSRCIRHPYRYPCVSRSTSTWCKARAWSRPARTRSKFSLSRVSVCETRVAVRPTGRSWRGASPADNACQTTRAHGVTVARAALGPARATAVLYARGELPRGPAVAVVGTRKPTRGAALFARELAGELAAAGVTVLSGGAEGIDTSAHRGALLVGGLTVVVAPSGFERPYPERHGRLFRRIVRHGGAHVSLWRADVSASDPNFFLRNRVLVALAHAVVVVEAPFRSGARNTAKHARRLGRPLFVAPSVPWNPKGAGCILELGLGARPLGSVRDVLALLETQRLHAVALPPQRARARSPGSDSAPPSDRFLGPPASMGTRSRCLRPSGAGRPTRRGLGPNRHGSRPLTGRDLDADPKRRLSSRLSGPVSAHKVAKSLRSSMLMADFPRLPDGFQRRIEE